MNTKFSVTWLFHRERSLLIFKLQRLIIEIIEYSFDYSIDLLDKKYFCLIKELKQLKVQSLVALFQKRKQIIDNIYLEGTKRNLRYLSSTPGHLL